MTYLLWMGLRECRKPIWLEDNTGTNEFLSDITVWWALHRLLQLLSVSISDYCYKPESIFWGEGLWFWRGDGTALGAGAILRFCLSIGIAEKYASEATTYAHKILCFLRNVNARLRISTIVNWVKEKGTADSPRRVLYQGIARTVLRKRESRGDVTSIQTLQHEK